MMPTLQQPISAQLLADQLRKSWDKGERFTTPYSLALGGWERVPHFLKQV